MKNLILILLSLVTATLLVPQDGLSQITILNNTPRENIIKQNFCLRGQHTRENINSLTRTVEVSSPMSTVGLFFDIYYALTTAPENYNTSSTYFDRQMEGQLDASGSLLQTQKHSLTYDDSLILFCYFLREVTFSDQPNTPPKLSDNCKKIDTIVKSMTDGKNIDFNATGGKIASKQVFLTNPNTGRYIRDEDNKKIPLKEIRYFEGTDAQNKPATFSHEVNVYEEVPQYADSHRAIYQSLCMSF